MRARDLSDRLLEGIILNKPTLQVAVDPTLEELKEMARRFGKLISSWDPNDSHIKDPPLRWVLGTSKKLVVGSDIIHRDLINDYLKEEVLALGDVYPISGQGEILSRSKDLYLKKEFQAVDNLIRSKFPGIKMEDLT